MWTCYVFQYCTLLEHANALCAAPKEYCTLLLQMSLFVLLILYGHYPSPQVGKKGDIY
jgi:hypothetical protein